MQLLAVKEWGLHEQTGGLINSLKGHFSIQSSDTSTKLTLRYVKYMRFLDIGPRGGKKKTAVAEIGKKRKGYEIYNKILFGRIYRSTMGQLRFQLTEDAENALLKELEFYKKIHNYHF